MTLLNGRSVLILEDDDTTLEAAGSILRAAGFDVTCAHDFYDAFATITCGTDINIALVDVFMPRGTPHGICFARMAQTRLPQLKVIFMSSHRSAAEPGILDEGAPLLRKPFTPRLLLQAITRAAA